MSKVGEPELIKEFNCPLCGRKETLGEQVVGEEARKRNVETGPISLWKEAVAMFPPTSVQGITMPLVLVESDICGNCGSRYTIRVSKMDAPILLGNIDGTPPRGSPFLRG